MTITFTPGRLSDSFGPGIEGQKLIFLGWLLMTHIGSGMRLYDTQDDALHSALSADSILIEDDSLACFIKARLPGGAGEGLLTEVLICGVIMNHTLPLKMDNCDYLSWTLNGEKEVFGRFGTPPFKDWEVLDYDPLLDRQ